MTAGRFRLSAGRQELLRARLRAEGFERTAGPTVPARPDPAAPVPLTFAQQRLWFLEHLAAHGTAYVITAALRVLGDFRPEVFARACEEVVRRHESLRTVFTEVDGRPVQLVRDDLRPEVRIVELPGLPADAMDAEIRRREAALVGRPFDLGTGPLLRVDLLRFGPDRAAVLLTLHHLVSDRWSMGVLMRELTQAYGAVLTGRPGELPPLPVQYPDFAGWQQASWSASAWDADLAYWRRQLAGVPVELGLPTDRPRPPEKTYRGSSVPVELPPALVAPLRELARAEGATLFMVLAAAWKALLWRLSGTADVVVGTPVANRALVELEPLVGLFVNTVALRTDLRGNPPFRELVRRVAAVCVAAYEHQGVPFDRLVEELQPVRSLAGTPVFQVLLSYQNVPFPAWESGGVRVEPVALEATKAEFDLLLDLFEDGDTVWGRLEYSVDLFGAETAGRIAAMFRRLAAAAAADPDRRIGRLDLLGPVQREALLAGSVRSAGAGGVTGGGLGSVPEQVAARAAETPDAPAVRCGGATLDYAGLDHRADRLAQRLRQRGVGPGTLVGGALPASPELVVGLLGVLRAGAGWLPVDPDRPEAAPAAAVVVLTAGPAGGDGRLLPLDQTGAGPTGPTGPTGVPPDGDDVACVTGDPGLLVTHRGLRDAVAALQERHRLDRTDRVLQVAEAATPADLLRPLTAGATLVLAPPGAAGDPDRLLRTVAAEQVTAVALAGPQLHALQRDPGCGSVRTVLPAPGRPGPAPGTLVLDAELEPAPVGVPGELCHRGAGTARGYLDRPDLTADRFLPDPYGGPGARLHRTGELARRLPDGSLELLGRAGDQVTVRGYRVRPEQVEAALVEHGGIVAAAVVARPAGDGPGDGHLVAYLVAADADHPPTAAELGGHLRVRLPDYAVPAAFVVLPALPLTPLGTVDAAALPELAVGGGPRAAFVPPRGELERSLAELWQDLLGVPRVGAQDDFFALGGHSLLATKLTAQVRATYGVRLPLREFFARATVAALAAWITERQAAGDAPAAGIPVADRSGPLPLSFAQEGLVRHHPVPAEDPYHNVVTGLRLTGDLDEAALRRALTAVTARHEALRTRIEPGPDGPGQVVSGTADWPLTVVDLSELDPPSRPAELHRLVTEAGRRPYRLADEPPVRAVLARLGERERALLLSMHHLVTDNWSYGVLVRDLGELYAADVAGRPPRLPALPVQYPDVAAWQRRQLASGALDGPLRHWRGQLADLPPALAFAAPETAVPVTGATHGFTVEAGVTEALRGLARQEGATLFMVLLAAFDVLLAAFSGSDDVPVAYPEAGRDQPETADLIGFFVGTLVVRADLSGPQRLRDLVGQVRSRVLDADAHRGVPLWAVPRSPTGLDPTRLLLNLLNATVPAPSLPGLEIRSLEIGADYVFSEVLGSLDPAAVDAALILREDGPRLRGMWLCSPDRVDPRALGALQDGWERLLAWIAADPDPDVGALRRRLIAPGGGG